VIRRIQHDTENNLAKLDAPGGLPRLQKKKFRVLNEYLINFLMCYKQKFKFRAFKTWIFKVINFVRGQQ